MMLWLCAFAALAYVLVVACLVIGWGGAFSIIQKVGLAMSASGLVGACIPRLNGAPPNLGDLAFLVGLTTFLIGTYGPALFAKLDSLDGALDRRITLQRRPTHDA